MADKRKEFIRKYKHIAIREMERTGIPASITLAQGILESGCGESELAVNANNHFGIKCHETWNGDTYTMDDDTRNECFRKYKNIEQSWIDHSDFLTSRPRYAGLFSIPTTDYKAWAKGLKAAGYVGATLWPGYLSDRPYNRNFIDHDGTAFLRNVWSRTREASPAFLHWVANDHCRRICPKCSNPGPPE